MSKLALGSVQFGVDYGVSSTAGQVRFEEVKRILGYAYSKNINVLDTAPAYGNSEQILGKVNVSNFKVVTKTRHFDGGEINSSDIISLKSDFYRSLKNLRQDSIHAILIHNAEALLKPNAEKLFDQLKELKLAEKVKKVGVSVYDHSQLQSILDNFDIDLVQLPFNILDRRMIENGMLAKLQMKGIEVHARSVFLQGLLLMSDRNRPDKFNRWSGLWRTWQQWLNDNQITALEAAVRYAISMPEISRVLVGVETKDQLEEIVSASVGGLPDIPLELFSNDADLLNPSRWNRL